MRFTVKAWKDEEFLGEHTLENPLDAGNKVKAILTRHPGTTLVEVKPVQKKAVANDIKPRDHWVNKG